MTRRTDLLPITITRLDVDHYLVGRVTLTRVPEGWAAVPPKSYDSTMAPLDRPLFTAATLEEALDMAAGIVTMLAPA